MGIILPLVYVNCSHHPVKNSDDDLLCIKCTWTEYLCSWTEKNVFATIIFRILCKTLRCKTTSISPSSSIIIVIVMLWLVHLHSILGAVRVWISAQLFLSLCTWSMLFYWCDICVTGGARNGKRERQPKKNARYLLFSLFVIFLDSIAWLFFTLFAYHKCECVCVCLYQCSGAFAYRRWSV